MSPRNKGCPREASGRRRLSYLVPRGFEEQDSKAVQTLVHPVPPPLLHQGLQQLQKARERHRREERETDMIITKGRERRALET